MTPNPRWSLMIHGGCGRILRERLSAEDEARARAALARALNAGEAILVGDGSALDAVEAAVRVLEDDPHFNAGRGAALGLDGRIELDAAIMDGRGRAAGAVAGVTTPKNPVSLARAVMEHSPHVFLAGAGADAFAAESHVERAEPGWFATDERRRQLDALKAERSDVFDWSMKYGTVGAVACDTDGHVAAATSTGGVTGKRPGRIGDSPVIGAGTWADDRGCAVSATGAGEFFLRAAAAHELSARVRIAGESIDSAARAVLAEVEALGGTGGVIVSAPSGALAWGFTTPGMYRARATSDGARVIAMFGDEA
jgi:beta-aspartyl-peptidase (threonine type)